MKSVAVLLDGGFLDVQMRSLLNKRAPTATEISAFAHACARPDHEEIFRIFYYDCPPLRRTEKHPISGEEIDFSSRGTAHARASLQAALSQMNFFALRAGELSFDGWEFTPAARNRAVRALKSDRLFELRPEDLKPDIKQKRVDMMIGLDIAWLASKHLVDRLILVTADTDFVPAMKFARREGVQVVIVPLGKNLSESLRVHADEVRDIPFPVPAAP